jgi:hypothetical protein
VIAMGMGSREGVGVQRKHEDLGGESLEEY